MEKLQQAAIVAGIILMFSVPSLMRQIRRRTEARISGAQTFLAECWEAYCDFPQVPSREVVIGIRNAVKLLERHEAYNLPIPQQLQLEELLEQYDQPVAA